MCKNNKQEKSTAPLGEKKKKRKKNRKKRNIFCLLTKIERKTSHFFEILHEKEKSFSLTTEKVERKKNL